MSDNKVEIPILDIHVVDHCNFHCVGCNHTSPGAPRKVYDVGAYQDSINKLADFARVDCLCIVGGEPGLHPDLPGFLSALKWQKLANRLRLYSNGFWLPNAMPEKMVHSLQWVTELHISLHPELLCKITLDDIRNGFITIKNLAPSIQIDFEPEMTFVMPVFSVQPEVKKKCRSFLSVQLTPEGELVRCPQIKYARRFLHAPQEFLNAASLEDTRFNIAAGTVSTFAKWYHSWPKACQYCRWGDVEIPHASMFLSENDLTQLDETFMQLKLSYQE